MGSNAISTAANRQVSAGDQAISGINSAVSGAQNAVNSATASGQAGVNNATASGQAGIQGALGTAGNLYGTEASNLSPYLQAGQQGVTSLASMLQPGGALTQQFSFNPSNLQNTPGYQFQLQQGDQAINAQGAATGSSGGGSTAAALSQYNQGLAGTTFNNAYNQALTTFQTNRANTLQPLSTLINTGQQASGQANQAAQGYSSQLLGGNEYSGSLGQQGAQYSGNLGEQGAQYSGNAGLGGANNIASILQGIGNVQASAALGQGGILSGALNPLSGGINAGLGASNAGGSLGSSIGAGLGAATGLSNLAGLFS